MKKSIIISITIILVILIISYEPEFTDYKNNENITQSTEISNNIVTSSRPNKVKHNLDKNKIQIKSQNIQNDTIEREISKEKVIKQDFSNNFENLDKYGKSIDENTIIKDKKNKNEIAEYKFYIEDVNDDWRINNEDTLLTLFKTEIFSESILNNVTCRSITCRADISHISDEKAKAFEFNFISSLDGTSAFEFEHIVQLDGSISTIIYYKPVILKSDNKNAVIPPKL